MTFNLISKFAVQQTGGAKNGGAGFLTIFLISLLILFIKVFLVQWTYNKTIPYMFNQKYRTITMMEALYLVILMQSLFN